MHSPDRLRVGYKMRFLKFAFELGDAAFADARKIRVPVLAMKGGHDTFARGDLIAPSEYDHFLKSELPKNATVLFYPNGDHLLTEGPTKTKAIGDVLRWLNKLAK